MLYSGYGSSIFKLFLVFDILLESSLHKRAVVMVHMTVISLHCHIQLSQNFDFLVLQTVT